MPGKQPHLDFPLKVAIDGSEELYTQVGGVINKFTVQQVADFISGSISLSPFTIVDNNAALPVGGAIDENRIYIVKDWDGSGESESVVWDAVAEDWQIMDEEETDYVVVANDVALPVIGDPKKIYHVLDNGSGEPIAKRYNTGTGTYINLAPSGGSGGSQIFEKTLAAGINVLAAGSTSDWGYALNDGTLTITMPSNAILLGITFTGTNQNIYNEGNYTNAFRIRIISGSAIVNQAYATALLKNAFVIDGNNSGSISNATPLVYDPGLVEKSISEISGGTVSIVFNQLDNYSGGWIVGF